MEKKTLLAVLIAMPLAAVSVQCTSGNSSSASGNAAADSASVTESSSALTTEKIKKDWQAIADEWDYIDASLLNRYQITDYDEDGNPEVLLYGDDSAAPSGILLYKNGVISDSYLVSDGYNSLSICKGDDGVVWFVDEYDDHMGESRTWSTSYYNIKDCKLVEVGSSETIFQDGEISDATCDLPEGTDVPLQTPYCDMEGWNPIDLSTDE